MVREKLNYRLKLLLMLTYKPFRDNIFSPFSYQKLSKIKKLWSNTTVSLELAILIVFQLSLIP